MSVKSSRLAPFIDLTARSTKMALANIQSVMSGHGTDSEDESDVEQRTNASLSSPGQVQQTISGNQTGKASPFHMDNIASYVSSRRKRLRSDDDDEENEDETFEDEEYDEVEGRRSKSLSPVNGQTIRRDHDSATEPSSEEETIEQQPSSRKHKASAKSSHDLIASKQSRRHQSSCDTKQSPLSTKSFSNNLHTSSHSPSSSKRSTMDDVLRRLNRVNNHPHPHQSKHRRSPATNKPSEDDDKGNNGHHNVHPRQHQTSDMSHLAELTASLASQFPFDLTGALSSLANQQQQQVPNGDAEQQLTSLIDQLQMLRQKLVAQPNNVSVSWLHGSSCRYGSIDSRTI